MCIDLPIEEAARKMNIDHPIVKKTCHKRLLYR